MQTQQIMTQEQCERAVKALQESGFNASHIQGAPDDHGVWLDSVWDEGLQESNSFRIHDEEIRWWAPETKDK
jgi:hypothetical protein